MSLQFWANISAVWLALLCFIGTIIPVVVTYFAIRGMHAVLGKSRTALETAQDYSDKVRSKTDSISQRVARPMIRVESEVAKANKVIRDLGDDIA